MDKLNLSLTQKLVNIQKGKMQGTTVCKILKYKKCFSEKQEHQALKKPKVAT